jgi:hypothetical protein
MNWKGWPEIRIYGPSSRNLSQIMYEKVIVDMPNFTVTYDNRIYAGVPNLHGRGCQKECGPITPYVSNRGGARKSKRKLPPSI